MFTDLQLEQRAEFVPLLASMCDVSYEKSGASHLDCVNSRRLGSSRNWEIVNKEREGK
jgi:hypothetical protein